MSTALWTQLGLDIDGEDTFDYSGRSVSMSTDGMRVAIGANGNGSINRGHVRVYQYIADASDNNKMKWTQMGADIDGEGAVDNSGISVSMSADGTRVAIGANENDSATLGSSSGHVRVYNWSGTAWVQMGDDIDGEGANDKSGFSVSMNAEGTRVAIGAYQNDGPNAATNTNDDRGHVRVYQLQSDTDPVTSNTIYSWVQLGLDIDGKAEANQSGWSVSMSRDGTRVAIGAYGNDSNGSNSGHVCVYNWSGSAWGQMGQDIDGEAASDNSGISVSMNADGTRVAIGAIYNDDNGNNSGHVRVYNWSGTDWVQMGTDIDGEAGEDQSGYSVSLSALGTRVAIGALYNDGNNGILSDSGHVRVYEYKLNNGTMKWEQIGADIDGEAVGDQSGISVSLSPDGKRVAIGASSNRGINGTVNSSGHVRVYQLPSAPGAPTNVSAVAANAQAVVSFTPPENDGGSPIISYTVSSSDGVHTATGTESPITVTGLINDIAYAFTVVATNIVGSSFNSTPTSSVVSYSKPYTNLIPDIKPDGSPVSGDTQYFMHSINVPASGDINLFVKTNSYAANEERIIGLYANGSSTNILQSKTTVIDNDKCFLTTGGLKFEGNIMNTVITGPSAKFTNLSPGRYYIVTKTEYNDYGMDVRVSFEQNGSSLQVTYDQWSNTEIVPAPALWQQLGLDIDGEAANDWSGYSVSMSEDGTWMAIGANGNGSSSGHVRVYNWSGTAWVQMGQDIDGENAGDQSGRCVSLSANGERVAIGAYQNDGNGFNSGHVRVYQLQSVIDPETSNTIYSWVQMGVVNGQPQDIDGENAGDWSGYSVSISGYGSKVAIGANYNNDNGSYSGHVRVYNWSGSAWVQMGDNIVGENAGDWSGISVSLSKDGERMAIGAIYNDRPNTNDNRGHVRVYQLQSDTDPVTSITTYSWVQMGDDIDGEDVSDNSGQSVSMSADGERVAIGAIYNDGNGSSSGHVRVYKLQTQLQFQDDSLIPTTIYSWAQMGQDIDGEDADDYSGRSVSMNEDGTRVAIGAYGNDSNGSNSGHVRVYYWSGTDWVQIGANIDGEDEGDWSGFSVSLSKDGEHVAIGAYRNDDNGNNSGHVRVYQLYAPNPADTLESLGVITDADDFKNAVSATNIMNGELVDLSSLNVSISDTLEPTVKRDAIKSVITEIFTQKTSVDNFKVSKTELPLIASNAKNEILVVKSSSNSSAFSLDAKVSDTTSVYAALATVGDRNNFSFGNAEFSIIRTDSGYNFVDATGTVSYLEGQEKVYSGLTIIFGGASISASTPTPAPHTVSVNLNITANATGTINIFGEPLPTVDNVIIAETKLPVTALYTATNSMFEFWEPSADQDSRLAELATTGGRNWKLLTDSLEKGIQGCLEGVFNVEAATPFNDIKYSGMYDSVLNFGDLALRSYVHYVLGHVDATFAITNDVAFKRAMLSHDATTGVYKHADAVDYSSATITGSNADAKLARLLVKAIASKDGAAVLAIANQVIGQDGSRASGEDNNEITGSKRQALKFIAGDVIYMNIQLQTPNLVLGTGQQVSKPDLEGKFSGENYTLKITLE